MRSNIEASHILPTFYQTPLMQLSLNYSTIAKNSGHIPKAIIIFGVLPLGIEKNNSQSTAKCVLQVFIWTEMATATATTYGLSLLCSSNNAVPTHSAGLLTPFKWLLINREFVLTEWSLSHGFTAYYWATSQRHVKKGHVEVDKMTFYLGMHFNSVLDRPNITLHCKKKGAAYYSVKRFDLGYLARCFWGWIDKGLTCTMKYIIKIATLNHQVKWLAAVWPSISRKFDMEAFSPQGITTRSLLRLT